MPRSRPLVWVVDDSTLDAGQAARALEPDCEARIFNDGSAVLEELATSAAPDAIVLDRVMPGVSGLELLRFLRSQPGSFPQLPVLLLTALDAPEQIAEGLSAGANDYVHKPFVPVELRARVYALLRSAALLRRALEAEHTVDSLLAGSPDALFAVDAEGVVEYANPKALEIVGLERAAAVGRAFSRLLPGLGLAELTTGFPPHRDLRLDDRIYSPSVSRTDESGRTIVTLRDVTERRRHDQRRLDFYSVVAHDLRTPLMSVLLRSEAIARGRRGPLPAEVIRDVRVIDRNLHAMLALVNDFLDLARLEATELELSTTPLDLRELVAASVEEFRPLADASNLQLRWEPSPEPSLVTGDRRRLAQVLANLLGNAIKFTPGGGDVAVDLVNREGHVEVGISDTGPGVPDEILPVLFERFTRAPTQNGAGGTGLGLMIVREIVEAHGGKVGVESRSGQGSRFWFRVPAGSRSPSP